MCIVSTARQHANVVARTVCFNVSAMQAPASAPMITEPKKMNTKLPTAPSSVPAVNDCVWNWMSVRYSTMATAQASNGGQATASLDRARLHGRARTRTRTRIVQHALAKHQRVQVRLRAQV